MIVVLRPATLDSTDHIAPDLSRLRASEDAAWSLAYPLLWRAVMTVVTAKLGSSGGDAENLASDILCTVIIPQVFDPKADSFREIRSFEDLLQVSRAVARNRTIDFIRHSIRRPEVLHADVPEMPCIVTGEPEGPDLMELIQRHLNPPDPELFHDRFALGLTTREIAAKRNIPHGQVCSRFSRALKSLAAILKAGQPGGES